MALVFFKDNNRGGVGGGRYASAHKVSPFGFQENFSFSAFPTICFKHVVRQDGCGVLLVWFLFYRGPGSSRPPPTGFSHPPSHTGVCARTRKTTLTWSTSLRVTPG